MTVLEKLRWKKFPVLNDGFVSLVDIMGDDSSVVQAARVSYGEETKKVSDDESLIRYLMRHYHTTPFEMVEFKFLIRVPMDCWRQWIRHRTASVNEYSTRYSEAIDSQQKTDPCRWRSQSISNKQGSDKYINEWPEGCYLDEMGTVRLSDGSSNSTIDDISTPGKLLTLDEEEFHLKARRLYERRLLLGVAREQARKDLPLSTYTEAYWKIDLHNLFHFLRLRMDSHAQEEIRSYATIIGNEIVAKLVPMCWRAFEDYRLNVIQLSSLDIDCIQDYFQKNGRPVVNPDMLILSENKREKEETLQKLKRLGFID